jgi:ABC-type transport system involved in multi-copper enzyme maturation permease subunit
VKTIWIVGRNTFKEVIRDRILYGLIVFSVLIMSVSFALGQLSFAEQTRISANFGLAAIHIGAICIAIFVGSTLVMKELDKQTILTILVRPLSRTEFILGKFVGLSLVIATVMAGLGLVLAFVFILIGMELSIELLFALFGIFLESICLLAFALLFSMFARPVLVVCFSAAVFLIGHWFSSLKYFSEKAPGSFIDWTYKTIRFFIPNLEMLNWKNLVVYHDSAAELHIASSAAYSLIWTLLLIVFTAVLFERKDLV